MGAFVVGIWQLIYWKYCTGHWFAYNHGEQLAFTDPYTFKFLFSYKKGWLLYTPLMLFAIAGFYFLYKKNKKVFFPLFIFFVLNVYTLSSWECWWYAVTFSQRPVVEMYQLLAIPFGFLISGVWGNKIKTQLLIVLLGLLTLFNQFQIWQFSQGIIDGERMTKEYYWRVFLKTTATDEDKKYLEIERPNWDNEKFDANNSNYVKKDTLYYDFEKLDNNEKSRNIIDTFGYQSKKCFLLNSDISFSPGYTKAYKNISTKKHIWVKASVKVFPLVNLNENNANLVITFSNKGKLYKYKAISIKDCEHKPNEWGTIEVDYMSPHVRHGYDELQIYFWNQGGLPILIDNLKVEIFEPVVEY